MDLGGLTGLLGPEIDDPDEETFMLFSHDIPSQNLGFVDSRASILELTIAGRDLTIHQSPSVLSSNRAGGTTGADNILSKSGIISSSSAVLELGCGISGIVGLALSPQVSQYILSDQAYVARLVEQNLTENSEVFSAASHSHHGHKPSSKSRRAKASNHQPRYSPSPVSQLRPDRIRFTPLDWESDAVTPSILQPGPSSSFDAVLACDCIYNEALIPPFVQTCADACRLRAREEVPNEAGPRQPCVCVVAQQLRDPGVFEAWIERFAQDFHVWRVPHEALPGQLRPEKGFVVHVGVLRESSSR